MKDYMVKAYCFDKTVRIYACNSTNLVEKARLTHGLWPTVTAALGRTLTVAAMMSAMDKSNENLTIRVEGDGPIGKMIIEASDGKVRGTVDNPEVFLQYNSGKLDVGHAVGKNGYIHVIKDLHMKQPFTSTIDIQTGEIAEDFTYYFAYSEQTPSSVGLGVLVDTDNSCIAAGGFILQIMNGCTEETLDKIEEILSSLKPTSQMIQEGYTPEMIVSELTDDVYQLLETKEIGYYCPCSKERFYNGIKTIGKDAIQEIINEDHKAEVVCRFCSTKYDFNEDELNQMIDEL